MADYILAVAKGKSQNRFVTSFSANIDLLSCCCVNCDIVIDTGCMYTKLAASSFGDVNYKKLHQEDIKNYKSNRIGLLPSFGTTDIDRNIDLCNVSDDMLNSDSRICFAHELSNVCVGSYAFNALRFGCKVGYKKAGSSLLGMNLLKQMDFHCGYSQILKRFVFIGCLYSDINVEYLKVLSEHLGYLPNTSFMRHLIHIGKVNKNHPFVFQEYIGV